MADMHEATFSWPEVDANTVIVTGTFDQWSSSVHLTKTPRGFEGKVKLPWGDRVLYKFVVDGRWVTAQSQPEEPDASGNLNNVYECPSKPEPSVAHAPSSGLPSEDVGPEKNETDDSSSPAATAALAPLTEQQPIGEKVSQAAQQIGDAITTTANDFLPQSKGSALDQVHATVVVPVLGAAQHVVNDPAGALGNKVPPALVDTVHKVSETAGDMAGQTQVAVASVVTPTAQVVQEDVIEKTPEEVNEPVNATSEAAQAKGSGALAFVASNLGTAIHALTGVDPLNSDKIPVATPTPTHDAFEVRPQDPQVEPASQVPSQPANESELDISVSPDAKTVPTVNAVLHTMPAPIPSDSSETVPVTSIPHLEATNVETSVTPVVQDISDAPPVVNDILSSNAAVKDVPASTPTRDKETVISEIAAASEPETITPVPPTSTDTAHTAVHVPENESLQPKVNEATQPTTSEDVQMEPPVIEQGPTSAEPEKTLAPDTTPEAEHVQEPVEEHVVPPAEAPPAEVSPPQGSTALNTQTAAADVTTEAKLATTNAPPSETVASAPTADTPELLVPSAEKAANGQHPTTISSTPTKQGETDSSGPQAFPTTSSATSSPATAKSGSVRKKRTSIFGKMKQLFSSDKDEKREKKEKK